MEYKSLQAFTDTKAIDGRKVPGIFAIHGNIDSYADISHPGSFTKTLLERWPRVKFLWGHDLYSPAIAVIRSIREIRRDELPDSVMEMAPNATGGVEVVREYLKNEWAERVYEAVAQGASDEMSYGYDPIVMDFSEVDGKQVRNLREIRLYEISDVTFGANPATAGAKLHMSPELLLRHLDYFIESIKAGARHSDSDIKLINQIASAVAKLGATNIKLIEEDEEGKAAPLTAEQVKEKLLASIQSYKTQSPISISGLWLRAFSEKLQVLAEVDGAWRVAIEEALIPYADDLLISHIAEPLGIRAAPLDDIYVPAPVKDTSRAEEASSLHSLTLMRHQRQALELLDLFTGV